MSIAKRVCFVHCADPRWVGTYNRIARGQGVTHVPVIGSFLGGREEARRKLVELFEPKETFFLICSHWPCGAFPEEQSAVQVVKSYTEYFLTNGMEAAALHLSDRCWVFPGLGEIDNKSVLKMIERADLLSKEGWIVNRKVNPPRMKVELHFQSPLEEGFVSISDAFCGEMALKTLKKVLGELPDPVYGPEVSNATRELVLEHS